MLLRNNACSKLMTDGKFGEVKVSVHSTLINSNYLEYDSLFKKNRRKLITRMKEADFLASYEEI